MSQGFGVYGKIPTAGDFLRIGLPEGFVQPWDGWLQSALLTGRDRCGAQWDALYMTAPIWRFTLSAGLAGPSAAMGVLMPSVDRVGRRFPLTLAALLKCETASDLAWTHFAAETLFAGLEDLALSALDDDMTPAKLTDTLAGIRLPDLEPALTRMRRVGKTTYGMGASPLQAGMATAFLGASEEKQSLWTSATNGASQLMQCAGLPDGADIMALFDPSADAWNGEDDA